MFDISDRLKVRKGFTKLRDWIPILGIVPFVRNAPSSGKDIEDYISRPSMNFGEVIVTSFYTTYQVANLYAIGFGFYRAFN